MADDFPSYFDKSIAAVHDYSARFDRNYARPAYRNMKVYYDERPVISTFVTIFTLLSLVPVALFACTSLFVLITFTLVSLSLALLAASGVILALLGFLALVLIGTFFASLFLTGITLSSYFFLRLALHVRREGPSSGVSEWGKETKHTLFHGSAREKSNETSSFEKISPPGDKQTYGNESDCLPKTNAGNGATGNYSTTAKHEVYVYED